MADMIKNGTHGASREESYIVPTDPLILEHLEWFKDQKLALMMHFGPYAQLGVDASWTLPKKDAEAWSWKKCNVDWTDDIEEFRRQYINANKSFNPVRFQPEKWAEFAKENGFKYVIFTTKHHDGFCMFDTKYTDYKITAEDCPFHEHKYADIVKEVFGAFRAKGLGIAAYFSKPDWNCPWYWTEGMEKEWGASRNPTYVPSEHPEIWEKFIEFTHGQMMELIEDYGKVDILWLDGGQVKRRDGQDIRLEELVEKARRVQPGLIVVDRTAGGENENYITPEQAIPDHVIKVPWESCITVGTQWGYCYSDSYKPSRTLVKMLIDVVSRGGNLALNVGPQPDGRLPAGAMKELSGLGDWLKVNGEAIYGTRAADIAQIDNVRFTKKGSVLYALIPLDDGETLSDKMFIPIVSKVKSVRCLGYEQPLCFEAIENGITVALPTDLIGSSPCAIAFEFL